MKTRNVLSAAVLTVGLMLSSGAVQAQYQQGPPPGAYAQGPGGGWEAPPSEFQDELHRQGFHDGIEGARKDFDNHRRPNVNNRDEFRHPNVPGPGRRSYKEGFRRGYDVGVQHIYGNYNRRDFR
jgi:hypothetical protein